ncbi:hypothetical protein V6O07_16055, partial [Arthrospira platensis SPKY2]
RHQRERFAQWLFAQPEADRAALVRTCIESPDTNPGARMMLKSEISPSDYSAQALLRAWMSSARTEFFEAALPNPEDRSLEDWMAWRLAGGDASEA